MKIREWVRKRAALEREKPLLIPPGDFTRSRVNVDGEVEEVAYRESAPRSGRLEYVEPLDNQHIGVANDDFGVGNNVVRQMRVAGCSHVGGAAFYFGDEANERAPVI